MFMHEQKEEKVMVQKTVFRRDKSKSSIIFLSNVTNILLGDLNKNWGEKIFPNRNWECQTT